MVGLEWTIHRKKMIIFRGSLMTQETSISIPSIIGKIHPDSEKNPRCFVPGTFCGSPAAQHLDPGAHTAATGPGARAAAADLPGPLRAGGAGLGRRDLVEMAGGIARYSPVIIHDT